MKKPEEIKFALVQCAYNACGGKGCPYSKDAEDYSCQGILIADALALIMKLEHQLAKKNNLIDVLEEENDENT